MAIFYEWRRWIRPIVVCLYIVILLIALPFLIIEFQEKNVQIHLQAWFIGGIFTLLAVPISIWGILQHCIHYTQPLLQRHIIRIIWMVPIYAVNAWFALRFVKSALYLDTARECYEAYVIYNFMAYLMNFLWSEYPDLEEHLKEKPQVSHLIPFCCFPKWKNGKQILSYCKHGVLQYTVLRPLMTLIAFITQLAGAYNEGDFSPTSAWLYVTFVNNCSQIWAMYCLVLFYQATKEELAPIKPIPKFACIKAVVFFSFWQSVLISLLVYFGLIPESELFTKDQLASGLQDLLICIEMFLAALAHYYSFSHKPFVDYAQGHQNWVTSFKAMFDISDVREDVVNHVRTVGVTATQAVTRPLRKGPPPSTETEKSPLLRQSSNTSTENVDICTTSGGEDDHYACLATPPVVLTQQDFYNSVSSSHSAALSAYGTQPPPTADSLASHDLERQGSSNVLIVDVPAVVDEAREQTSDITGEVDQSEVSPQRELIDFASDSDNVFVQGPMSDHQLRGEDSLSNYTIESTASEQYLRRSLTASMNNYAQFSDPSVTSTRSNSPSRSSHLSEK